MAVKPRVFRALLWLRWRETVNAMRGGRRGSDALERVSSVIGAIAPVLLTLLVLPGCLGTAAGGFGTGWFAAAEGSRRVALTVMRYALFLVTLFAFLAPVLAVMSGGASSPARLLLMPIPRFKLYLGEIVSRLADPFLLIFVPGVLAFPCGLLVRGEAVAALVAAVAGLVLVAILLVGQSLIAFAISLLLRDRRRGELLAIAVLVVVSTLGLVTAAVGEGFEARARARKASAEAAPGSAAKTVEQERPPLHPATALVPSEMHVQAVEAALERRPLGALWRLGVGLVLLAGIDALARHAHGRLLEQPAGGSSRRGARSDRFAHGWSLPGVRPSVAALATAHVRAARRSLPGKVGLLFPSMFAILIAFVMRAKLERLPEDFPFAGPVLLASGIVVLCLMMLQQELVNLFAKDGPGLTLQLVQPLADRDLVLGKILGSAVQMLVSVAPALILVAVITRGVPLLTWLGLVLLAAAGALWSIPVGTILSAVLPKKVDLSSFKTAKPHQGAALVAVLGGGVITGLPVLAALLIGEFAGFVWAFGFALFWLALSAGVALVLVGLACEVLSKRRENLALVVQGS